MYKLYILFRISCSKYSHQSININQVHLALARLSSRSHGFSLPSVPQVEGLKVMVADPLAEYPYHGKFSARGMPNVETNIHSTWKKSSGFPSPNDKALTFHRCVFYCVYDSFMHQHVHLLHRKIHQIQSHQISTECFQPSHEWNLKCTMRWYKRHKHFKLRSDNNKQQYKQTNSACQFFQDSRYDTLANLTCLHTDYAELSVFLSWQARERAYIMVEASCLFRWLQIHMASWIVHSKDIHIFGKFKFMLFMKHH